MLNFFPTLFLTSNDHNLVKTLERVRFQTEVHHKLLHQRDSRKNEGKKGKFFPRAGRLIISNEHILCNPCKFFESVNMENAREFYEWFKNKTIEKFTVFLSNQETQFGDGGFTNTESERLLTEPIEELQNQSVISIIYGADLVELLPCEEITNTLQAWLENQSA